MCIGKKEWPRKVVLIDLENVIRNGVVSSSKYDEEYKNWKYRMVGTTDGRNIEVIIALDPTEDYEASPFGCFSDGVRSERGPWCC